MDVDDSGQFDIEVAEALDIVGSENELNPVVDGKEFRMVAHLLSLEGNGRQEAESFDEIFKMDRSRQFYAVDQLPHGQGCC